MIHLVKAVHPLVHCTVKSSREISYTPLMMRKTSAIKVSKLLVSKAEQDQRITSVFREYRDE